MLVPLRSISRRRFLAQGSLAAFAWDARALFAQPAAPAQVWSPSGPLRGEAFEGVRYFRGVPFAQPPVGDLRFLPTVPVKPWKDELDATRFAKAAMQSGGAGSSHSEDCLYLNVWAPEGKGPFPVYVWIHGGSYISGNSFSPIYNGANYSREGIVCVTIAYRLGVLGFLDVEPLLGSSYAGSANNGLHDALTALAWVHDNIASFGGDPSRVTVGGQSAGGKLVCTLMGSPAAKPLFQQAICESGGGERYWSKADAALVAKGFSDIWTGQPTQPSVKDLLSAPSESLIKAQAEFVKTWPRGHALRPELDGSALPEPPMEAIRQGLCRGKRLLIGTNLDESVSFIGPHPQHDDGPSDLGNLPVDRFAPVYAKYKDIYPEMPVEMRRIRATTAEEYWVPSVRTGEACVQGGGEVYMYRFDFSETSGPLKGDAFHGLESSMAWGMPHENVDNAAAEAALSSSLHAAWSAFLRGEVPAGPGLPVWAPYRPDTHETMILNSVSKVERKPHEAELRLWDKVL